MEIGLDLNLSMGTSSSAGASFVFIDSFNRDDENLAVSPNWTRVGGVAGAAAIRSNEVAFLSTTETVYLCPDLGSADHFTQIERRTSAISGYFDCCVRITDTDNFIGVRKGDPEWELFKRVAGTFTQLGTSAQGSAIGDVVRLEANGDQLNVFRNENLIIGPITETDHQAVTRQGFIVRNTLANPAIDNFRVQVLS